MVGPARLHMIAAADGRRRQQRDNRRKPAGERLAAKRDQEGVLALALHGQEVAVPADVIKDPFVLEFLDLREPTSALERELEQAIIDRLEDFLLELGKGFCFVARQRHLTGAITLRR